MPPVDSNLLYRTAQQLNPWRAGTPGRAPWNRQAVVFNRRPLCLSIPQRLLPFATCALVFLAAASPAAGQVGFPDRMTVQLRLGAFGATSLVTDDVSSKALNDSLSGVRSDGI